MGQTITPTEIDIARAGPREFPDDAPTPLVVRAFGMTDRGRGVEDDEVVPGPRHLREPHRSHGSLPTTIAASSEGALSFGAEARSTAVTR